jgi:serine phosphatase RsbU (regulator of sigma subunit)
MVCPYDLLLNTKLELPPCKLIHDIKLRQRYEKAREKEGRDIWKIDEDVYRMVRRHVYDCDDRIKNLEAEQKKELEEGIDNENENIVEISARIEELSKRAEKLGEEGKIDESVAVMKEADSMKKLKEDVCVHYFLLILY